MSNRVPRARSNGKWDRARRSVVRVHRRGRVLDALHPQDRERTEAIIAQALAGHAPYDLEYRTRWPDGSVHWIAAKGLAYYDTTGTAVRMRGVVLDILVPSPEFVPIEAPNGAFQRLSPPGHGVGPRRETGKRAGGSLLGVEPPDRGIKRAVSAGDDDPVVGATGALRRNADQIVGTCARLAVDARAAGTEILLHFANMPPNFSSRY